MPTKILDFLTRLLLVLMVLTFRAAPAEATPPNTILGSVAACDPWDPQFCAVVGAPFHLVAAATNNSTLVAAGPRVVTSAQLGGVGAAPAYLKFYDKATAPVCGTDTPVKTLIIPAASTAANGAGSNVAISLGFKVVSGLGICVVTGLPDNDNTSVAAATWLINFDWK